MAMSKLKCIPNVQGKPGQAQRFVHPQLKETDEDLLCTKKKLVSYKVWKQKVQEELVERRNSKDKVQAPLTK